MASILNRIQSIEKLPKDVDPSRLDSVTCAALDLSSAILRYVVVALRHLKSNFTSATLYLLHCVNVGNLARNIFKGPKSFKDAVADLETATKDFNTAMSDFGLSLMSVSYRMMTENNLTLDRIVEHAHSNTLATNDLSGAMQLEFESFR
jgi:hypothetical protein